MRYFLVFQELSSFKFDNENVCKWAKLSFLKIDNCSSWEKNPNGLLKSIHSNVEKGGKFQKNEYIFIALHFRQFNTQNGI